MLIFGVIVGFLHAVDFKHAQLITAVITAFVVFWWLWRRGNLGNVGHDGLMIWDKLDMIVGWDNQKNNKFNGLQKS